MPGHGLCEARHMVRGQVSVIRLGQSGELDSARRVPTYQAVVEGLFHNGGETLMGLADSRG